MPRSRPDPAPVRRFLLAGDPEQGAPTLAPGELRHALRVMRLAPGDRLCGLDGRGASWPLEVTAVGRDRLELVRCGPPVREAEPGAGGAGGEWIELALSLPRGARTAAMVERLVQLGLARLRPVVSERSAPHAREAGAHRRERLERTVGEAMKQSGRVWPTLIETAAPLAEATPFPAGVRAVLLDGGAGAAPLGEVLCAGRATGPWTRAAPLVLWVGPEGGYSDSERAVLTASGALAGNLGPATLRTETAAEAALAVAVQAALADSP
ncbi:MAG: RsmE family RNA methyltransferase [Planctomycetota bacterium]|nr:RsmE family RNA methyltransferase [Planctomycetota bacterium]